MNKTNLEIAKECGFDMMIIAPSIVIDAEQLDAYTTRILEDKDAEIANLRTRLNGQTCYVPPEFQKQLDEANALIAMKDEALKEADGWLEYLNPEALPDDQHRIAFDAFAWRIESIMANSAESVAEWKGELLKPMQTKIAYLEGYISVQYSELQKENSELQRQVAMLRSRLDESDSYIRSTDNGGFSALPVIRANKAALSDTQATAEVFERELKAKVLEETAKLA